MDIQKLAQQIQEETEKIIVGKSEQFRLITMAALADGHVLLDDLPGVGKTTLVKTFSLVLGCRFGRIQFVPDMLPSDILGMRIFNQKTGDFELRHGPVMTNLLLADEINRAIPRTQSALLEAMEEHQVSIDTEQYPLPRPFLVLATQNPVESESTFHLPLLLAQQEIRNVTISDAVADYIVALCDATRTHPQLVMGASPRASRSLYRAAKAWAAMKGRNYATPDDVKLLAHPVLEHRLVLESGARFNGVTTAAILDSILDLTPAAPTLNSIAHEA